MSLYHALGSPLDEIKRTVTDRHTSLRPTHQHSVWYCHRRSVLVYTGRSCDTRTAQTATSPVCTLCTQAYRLEHTPASQTGNHNSGPVRAALPRFMSTNPQQIKVMEFGP